VGGYRGDVHSSGGDLDEEQHVDAFEEHGVDGEEAAGQDAVGLGGEELFPRGPVRRRSGVDAGAVQDVPDGAGGDLVAEADQFTVDASLSPGRVVGGQAQHQARELPGDRRAARAGVQVRPLPRDQLAMPT
jgi:hypothetical protein